MLILTAVCKFDGDVTRPAEYSPYDCIPQSIFEYIPGPPAIVKRKPMAVRTAPDAVPNDMFVLNNDQACRFGKVPQVYSL